MDLPADVKKQLMQMAGITDPKEFDQMAEKIAGKATQAAASTNPNLKAPPRQSPFQGKDNIFREPFISEFGAPERCLRQAPTFYLLSFQCISSK